MANSLRLMVAQLTDVGRKRERNQDNLAHVVPTDETLLREKGALFVVCDGMGGHAAGEVAAELGVNTVRESYYAAHDEDIITGLARAIEDANAAIYTHARTHPEHAGMGTTCVAIVLAEGRAYIVNIGDSRAYLIRNGKMRQITRDHSWVAEQQRMGLLTAEQARIHAHRNVITRSLGTQPTITADLFVEPIYAGDRFLLCSDGLHGYVLENEISATVLNNDPQTATQQLIDQANNNGGPDNITAIVVKVVETPAASGEVTLPTGLVSRAESTIDESTTQPLSTAAMQESADSSAAAAAAHVRGAPGVPASAPAASLPRVAPTPPPAAKAQPQTQTRKRRRGRGLAVALTLVAILLLAVAAGGGWYVFYGRAAMSQAANTQAQRDLTAANQTVQRAANEPPAQALTDLGQVRTTLQADEHTPVNSATKQHLEAFLSGQLLPAVRTALQRYNASAHIVPVAPTAVQSCLSTGAAVTGLVASTWAPPTSSFAATTNATVSQAQLLYALQGGQIVAVLVPLTNTGAYSGDPVTCHPVQIANISLVSAISVDGSTLNALVQNTNGTYSVMTLAPAGDTGGFPSYKIATRFTLPADTSTTPTLLATTGTQTYVAYSGAGGAGLWRYDGASPSAPSVVVRLPQPAISLTVANGTPYLLLSTGELGEIGSGSEYVPLPVSIQQPVAPADPNAYALATPVPTPQPTTAAPLSTTGSATATPSTSSSDATPTTAGQATTTLFAAGGTLAAPSGAPTRLLVEDAANGRVVWFGGGTTTDVAPSLGAQFVSAPQTGTGLIAVSPRDNALLVFTWTTSGLSAFLAPTPTTGS